MPTQLPNLPMIDAERRSAFPLDASGSVADGCGVEFLRNVTTTGAGVAELAWQLMLRRIPAIVWTTDRNLLVASAGSSGCGDLGHDAQHLVGKHVATGLGGDNGADGPLVVAHLQSLQGRASSLDHVFQRKAYRLFIEPLLVDGRVDGCVGMAIDITPRKSSDVASHAQRNFGQSLDGEVAELRLVRQRLTVEVEERRSAEQVLRESHERLVQLAANIDSAFWIEDALQRRVIYLSPGYEKIWGQTNEAALRSPHAVWSLVHEDDACRVQRFEAARASGEAVTDDFRIRRSDGAIRWVRARTFPIRGAAGQVERIAGVAEDITRRKDDEALQRRSERLATLGSFVAGIAHEINNPLGAALTATQAAMRSLPAEASPLLHECLDTSLASIRRCTQIVRSLLRFCRSEPTTQSDFDLREVLSSAESITRSYAAENGCQLEVAQGSPALPVIGSPLELEMVFVNLLRNAVEAGATRVAIQTHPLGDQVEVRIVDNGSGISVEDAWRLCDPFFTTRSQKGGTGLGLSIVHSIIQEHRGRLDFEAGNPGTTARVSLPLCGKAGGRQ